MKTFAVLLLGLTIGCSKSEPAPAPSAPEPAPAAASAPAPTAPAADKPEQPAPPSEPAAAEPAKEMQPLSAYLGGAVAASVFSVAPNPSGGATVKEVQKLDEAATKAFLAKLDLTQKADGGLVKCPSDTNIELRDAAGKVLGTIGFCGDAARFDAPDGTFGGIKATKP